MPHPIVVIARPEVDGGDCGDRFCGGWSSTVIEFGAIARAEAKELASEDLRKTGKLMDTLARPLAHWSHAGDELARRRFGHEEERRLRARGERGKRGV